MKNSEHIITVTDIGVNFEGVTHIDGRVAFVPFALSGEKVKAKVLAEKPNALYMKACEIIEPSADRVAARCEVFTKCGGCVLQHCDYKKSLELKRKRVQDAFTHIAKSDVKVGETVPSKSYGYRNKATVPFVNGENGVVWGIYAPRSHRVVATNDCPINDARVVSVIKAVKEYCDKSGIICYDETAFTGGLRRVCVRILDNHYYVTVVSAQEDGAVWKGLSEPLSALTGGDYELYFNHNDSRANSVFGKKFDFIAGTKRAVKVGTLALKLSPSSFFQVNDGVREKLYGAVTSLVEGEYVVDAYSGVGIMTAMLARSAKKVAAVEIDKSAAKDAIALYNDNNIKNVKQHCGDCAVILPDIVKDGCTVVLDPPRAGCSEKVLDAITRAAKIVYVSCDPATLARDCLRLTERGFTCEQATPFDMFAQTAGVETLAVFTKH